MAPSKVKPQGQVTTRRKRQETSEGLYHRGAVTTSDGLQGLALFVHWKQKDEASETRDGKGTNGTTKQLAYEIIPQEESFGTMEYIVTLDGRERLVLRRNSVEIFGIEWRSINV